MGTSGSMLDSTDSRETESLVTKVHTTELNTTQDRLSCESFTGLWGSQPKASLCPSSRGLDYN